MESTDVIENVKMQLTGGILESEIDDEGYQKIVDIALKELNRYYNATELIELNGQSCIDLSAHPEIMSVTNVYRVKSTGLTSSAQDDTRDYGDPVFTSQLQMYNFGSSYACNDWMYRLSNWSTLQRLQNTLSTDLEWKEDKRGKKLYINFAQGVGDVVVEYIPRLHDVSDIIGEYWEDMFIKLVLAYSKISLGRIRTRYTQSGALWTQDGETMLTEGTNELTDLREKMRVSNDLFTVVD